MKNSNRRQFMRNVGSGMLVAGLGSGLACELGIADEALADYSPQSDYGKLTPWVRKMQELKPGRLQREMVIAIKEGSVNLKSLTSAAALANAETFGGQDYVGYHAEMALVPALQMADDMSNDRKPLPVLKVLYRNSSRIQSYGPSNKKLKPISTDTVDLEHSVDKFGPELRQLVRQADMDKAEQLFANVMKSHSDVAFDTLLHTIADEVDVHRFVLAFRGMSLIDVAGEQHSHTLLRQCVRHCVDFEVRRERKGKKPSPIRDHIPKLLDEYNLLDKPIGTRDPGSNWIRKMSETIFDSSKFESSRAVAAAIAEGISAQAICQAISLAANHLTLRQGGDPLRTHGASAGVHGSDAANAWRHMIGYSNNRNAIVGLMVSAWHTGRYFPWETSAYPLDEHFEKIKSENAQELLGQCEDAIRGNDQPTAAATIHRYCAKGYKPRPIFDLMLKYAVSEDGRLHSEKYYRTIREEYAFTKPEFRSEYLVALARVTASAYAFDVDDNHGHRAPGYVQACNLLKVSS